MRLTIDYGIDLGTTNSAISVQRGGKVHLLKGPHGDFTLPSAVYLNPDARLVVGQQARAALAREPGRVSTEFKRLMGTDELWRPTTDVSLAPEELSARVLSELCSWAEADCGRRPRAAVITVPAMFQLPQCDANRRAAKLAGIEHVIILQEPVAAAIAHSGGSRRAEGYWLVYDLGGGTFDVSLVRAKSGRLQVIDHDGNNHLGGRDMDRAVARYATGLIRERGVLEGFRRTDPRYTEAFLRLKVAAEDARLRLSGEESTEFLVDDIDGRGYQLSFPMDRELLERLLDPLITETTDLCLRVLRRHELSGGQLEGVVMVGGPTLTPFLPQRIEQAVGARAVHNIDPMTIVATGAALFASTQRMPARLARSDASSRTGVELQLEYPAMTTDPEPLVVIRAPAESGIHTIQIQAYSGRTVDEQRMSTDGVVATEVSVQLNAPNTFKIVALSASGRVIETTPSEFDILHGLSVANPPLAQSVGVMLADNKVHWYVKKGAVLPARGKHNHMTTKSLRQGESGDAVNVPLVQGDAERADRNKIIGVLRIFADGITRDLPSGSEVEVTIEIDESSQTRSVAYVPLLGQKFEDVILFDMGRKDPAKIKQGVQDQRKRLEELSALADSLEDEEDVQVDERIEELEALLEDGDRDSVDVAEQMLRTLTVKLDGMEKHSKHESLSNEGSELLERASGLVEAFGEANEKRQFLALKAEFEASMRRGDLDLAQERIESFQQLEFSILTRIPEFWIGYFRHLVEQIKQHGLSNTAGPVIERGQQAAANNSVGVLRAVCFELLGMLPREEQERVESQGFFSHLR